MQEAVGGCFSLISVPISRSLSPPASAMNKDIFNINKVKHPELSACALNPMTSVLMKEDTDKRRHRDTVKTQKCREDAM